MNNKVILWYGRCKGGYFFVVKNEELKKMFEEISKFGYTIIHNPYYSRIFGMKLRPFRTAGVFFMGWDKMKNTTILALSRRYEIRKDGKTGEKFFLYERTL